MQRLEARFLATAMPSAEQVWTRVRDGLDRYAARWSATQKEACRATRIEGRQSDSLLDLRTACLDRRRTTLAALTELWSAQLDKAQLEQAGS